MNTDSSVDKEIFWKNLLKYRSSNGTLIINLHGSHISTFDNFRKYFSNFNIVCLHLIRANVMKQAVSYAIAKKTGQWTEHYKSNFSENDLKISNSELFNFSKNINQQNLKINAYIHSNKFRSNSLLYEDLLRKNGLKKAIDYLNLNTITGIKTEEKFKSLVKQSSKFKDNLIDQFAKII